MVTNTHNQRSTSSELEHWYPPFVPTDRSAAPTAQETFPSRSGLDDPTVAVPTTAAAPTFRPRRTCGSVLRSRRVLVATGAVVTVVGIGTGVATALSGSGADPSTPAAPGMAAATTTSTAPAPAAWCDPKSAPDGVVVGNGVGGTGSGANALLAFDHAFYVERSGTKARGFVAPDATGINSAEGIQTGIDLIPIGSEHCVSVREVAPGRFIGTLRERRPGGEEIHYPQVITTTVIDGRHLLTSIGVAE